MNLIQSLFLGLVQGITEFLPISSSGHLNLFQYFFSLTPSLTFDIFLNTATFLSVLVFFRKDLKYFFSNLIFIVIASLPAALAGIFFKDTFESIYQDIKLLPIFYLITTILLFSTKFAKEKNKLNLKSAIIIGLAQAVAILPGVSRSGATIATALLLGLSPATAFKFSFCLFIPASLGTILLDYQNLSNVSISLIPAFILTFFVGLISLRLLRQFVQNHSFWYFSVYTLILSIFLFVLLWRFWQNL
jgi:undecaprenyl-diphosphatase